MQATVVHFTIPVRFDQEKHPLGCRSIDWFDVEVPFLDSDPEASARMYVAEVMGNGAYFTTYTDGPEWDRTLPYRPGKCVTTLAPWRVDSDSAQASLREHVSKFLSAPNGLHEGA